MLKVLTAGLSAGTKELLRGAIDEIFGGTAEILELTKENLRSRVRLTKKDMEVVLVILDRVSSELCSDIENGLYSSDRYFTYTTDRGLAEFLNNKYGINLVVEDEIEEISNPVAIGVKSDDELEHLEKIYQEKLAFKNNVIQNLEAQLREIVEFYGIEGMVGVSSEELGTLKDENIRLNNDLLDCKSEIDRLREFESNVENLKSEKVDLENRIKKVSKNYDDVLSELNELKVTYSMQTGVMRDKENKIRELEKKIEDLEKLNLEISELKDNIQAYRSIVQEKDTEIGDLRVDLQSKDRELRRNSTELDSLRGLTGVSDKLDLANTTIASLKKELSDVSNERDGLLKDINEKDKIINQFQGVSDDNVQRINELLKENESLLKRVKDDNESLALLNKEKLELQSKLDILTKADTGDNSTDELIKTVQDLQRKLNNANSNIFTKIGVSALPNSSVNVKLVNESLTFKNIRFAFAGSAESRKIAYRCLLDEFRSDRSDTRFLLVDLVSETSVDYVFEIKKVVSGMEWFRRGGSVQQFLSDTVLRNVKVLSAGIGYINDSYFLCVDWLKRLKELENSGYRVVLFCGDVSNVIGRVFHESFASCGESIIYVSGSLIGCRTIVTNLRGLSNANASVIAYYEFNSNSVAKKFYDIVEKTNECRVLSIRNSARR